MNNQNDELHHADFRRICRPSACFFEELGNVHGAHGAKGIGELLMDGPAPAILNAIEDATGVRFCAIPLLPEDFA